MIRLLRHPLSIVLVVLMLLWLTGVRYPIISDTEVYALLGEHVWHGHGFILDGQPYAKHLPLHAVLSYPLVFIFGYSIGMKLSSLFAAILVVIVTYKLMLRLFDATVACWTSVAVALHHGFVWMSVVGSADLLYSALVLSSLYFFVSAEDDAPSYIPAGACLGLACLTRYNAVPLFAVYGLWVLCKRTSHVRTRYFWTGMITGVVILLSWFVRNAVTFGNPLHSEYTSELAHQSPDLWEQFLSNMQYYLHPLHNILPILLLCSLYGLWLKKREHALVIFSMIALFVLASVWWVQAMRFVFPVLVLLMGYGVYGVLQLQQRCIGTLVHWYIGTFLIVGLIASHVAALCLYSVAQCNAWWDESIGIIPQQIGISSEGFYAWSTARDYINTHAEHGDSVDVVANIHLRTWHNNVFRDDLVLQAGGEFICPTYRISTNLDDAVFVTESQPYMGVLRLGCGNEN